MNIREMQENTNKFFGNQGQTLYNGEQPMLNRIADALEKIARELERGNELKAIEIKMEAIPAYRDERDGDELAKIIQQDVNEIMEG